MPAELERARGGVDRVGQFGGQALIEDLAGGGRRGDRGGRRGGRVGRRRRALSRRGRGRDRERRGRAWVDYPRVQRFFPPKAPLHWPRWRLPRKRRHRARHGRRLADPAADVARDRRRVGRADRRRPGSPPVRPKRRRWRSAPPASRRPSRPAAPPPSPNAPAPPPPVPRPRWPQPPALIRRG